MPSAFIPSVLSYPAMPLAEQQVHQRYVQPGPLVLRSALLKFPTPVIDRDRTVSRRSEPSSRTALMGEQPNPWNRMPDALKEQVFSRLEELAAVANLSLEDRIAYDKALDCYRVSRIVSWPCFGPRKRAW